MSRTRAEVGEESGESLRSRLRRGASTGRALRRRRRDPLRLPACLLDDGRISESGRESLAEYLSGLGPLRPETSRRVGPRIGPCPRPLERGSP